MTRTAAAARVTRAGHFADGLQSAGRDFSFNGAFGDKETRADECLVAGPIVARGVAVFANRRQQRVACQFRAVLSGRFQLRKLTFYQCAPILPDYGRLATREIHNPLGQ